MKESVLGPSFHRRDAKQCGCGALFRWFLIALCFCTVLLPYLHLPNCNLPLSILGQKVPIMTTKETSKLQQFYNDMKLKEAKPSCDFSEPVSDICETNGDARIDGNSATIFVATSPSGAYADNSSWNIRPYGRKGDEIAMGKVRRFMIKATSVYEDLPHCRQTHDVPAILFSGGGYSGNHFHSFTDVLIPLFLTSREFNGEVQFLVSDFCPSWTSKYRIVIEKLSRYETIDIDKQEGVHCFPNIIVGLKHHKEFNIDPAKSRYSMKDFRQFLRGAYSLKRETAIKLRNGEAEKPRLLMITRRRTRAFMNEAEITNMARSLGYSVILTEPDADLSRFAHLVNSCDVMMGVHGAGLTNMVFLPENAVLIQVVPFGRMEWIARTDFGEPSKDMDLRYLEYKINAEESSLIQQYPLDHEIFREPYTIQKNGWAAFSSVYLEKQNVKLDVERFSAVLLEAFQLLQA